MIIPWSDVFVTHRPVDTNVFFCICFEVHWRPTIGLPAPRYRSSANMISADPVEGFIFLVRMFRVVHEPMHVCLADPSRATLYRSEQTFFCGHFSAVR